MGSIPIGATDMDIKTIGLSAIAAATMLFFAASCEKTVEKEIVLDNETELASSDAVKGEGGSFTLKFTAPDAWTAAVEGTAEWLSVSPKDGAAGAASLAMTTTENNESLDERSAVIVITSGSAKKSVTLKQAVGEVFALGTTSVEVKADGGAFTVGITTNLGYDVEVVKGEDWITFDKTTADVKNGDLKFTATANATGVERTGMITVCSSNQQCHSVKVTQAAK